jgi:hypothetical protein
MIPAFLLYPSFDLGSRPVVQPYHNTTAHDVMLVSSARPPQFGTQPGSKKDRNLIKDKELAQLYQAHQHRLATHTYKDAEMTGFAMMAYPLHNKLKQGQLNSTTRYPRNLEAGSITWLDISTPWNTLYRRFLCLDVFMST